MTTQTLANRYAKAFVAWAPDAAKQLSGVQLLVRTLAENLPLTQALGNPTLPRAAKASVAADVVSAVSATEELGTFVALIAQDNRLGALAAILSATEAALKTELGQEDVHVTAAAPLTEAQKKALLAKLAETSHAAEINLIETTDEALIGGFTVQQGPLLHDFSVKGQLASLQKHLAN